MRDLEEKRKRIKDLQQELNEQHQGVKRDSNEPEKECVTNSEAKKKRKWNELTGREKVERRYNMVR